MYPCALLLTNVPLTVALGKERDRSALLDNRTQRTNTGNIHRALSHSDRTEIVQKQSNIPTCTTKECRLPQSKWGVLSLWRRKRDRENLDDWTNQIVLLFVEFYAFGFEIISSRQKPRNRAQQREIKFMSEFDVLLRCMHRVHIRNYTIYSVKKQQKISSTTQSTAHDILIGVTKEPISVRNKPFVVANY